MQRFFGKRRRNEAKRAGCFGKPLKSEVYGDEKARRRGAVPANPLGDRLPLFPPRTAFFHWFHVRSMHLLNLSFSVGYGSIVPRGRQRPQNRRLKHLYKRIESRVRIVSLLGSFAVYEAFPDLYATILPLSR